MRSVMTRPIQGFSAPVATGWSMGRGLGSGLGGVWGAMESSGVGRCGGLNCQGVAVAAPSTATVMRTMVTVRRVAGLMRAG